MTKIVIDITEHGIDLELARVLRPIFTKLGTTGKARAQQIIGEEINDRSGKLKSSIGFDVRKAGNSIELELFSKGADPYALYQHEGTGIYGPKRRPIKAKKGKFLVWEDADSGDLIFAKQVRGTPGKKFLRRGIDFAIQRIATQQ